MLRILGASKGFGNRLLWNNVSFTVTPGEVVGLTGPSGCGKSTLLNCIGMLQKLDQGTITLRDTRIDGLSGRRRRALWRRDVGFLFQDFGLVENATARSNVQIVKPHLMANRRLVARSDSALQAVGLAGRGSDPAFQFSGGEQQRIALARIVAKEPFLVLADEPTGSLDPRNESMVLTHLRKVADQGGIVVIATHSPVVKESCDRLVDLELSSQAEQVL